MKGPIETVTKSGCLTMDISANDDTVSTENKDNTSSDKRLRVQITEEDLLCVNGCGFYGTPQWKGRCSKCWRAYQIQEKKTQDFAKNRELLSFEKFEGRRKLSTESRSLTLKSILRKSPSMTVSANAPEQIFSSGSAPSQSTLPSPGAPLRRRDLSEESRAASDHFGDYLKKNLPPAAATEIWRQTRHAITKITEQQTNLSMDDLSGMVQHFYQVLSDRMRHSPSVNDACARVTVEEVVAEIEQYLCVRAYSTLFCARADEEVADLSLQDRIRSLNWVTAGFLETTLDFTQQTVCDKLDEAITEMIDINSHRGAAEKLNCLVRCSKMIFEALKESRSGAPASADEYLPVLIYVLLKGNPPLIQSNVKFISRFALPSRVMSGESGYYFTNLSCALQFIQNMNAESLKMPKEEFEAYTSGHQVPPLNEKNCGCNQAIRSMENSLSQIRELLGRQRELAERIQAFELRVQRENDEFLSEIRDILNEYPSTELQRLGVQIAQEEELTLSACSLTSSSVENSRTSSRDHEEEEDGPTALNIRRVVSAVTETLLEVSTSECEQEEICDELANAAVEDHSTK
uniref:Rab5 GDP/GTP exchange factor n=1 Tax=Parascaris univalens TaxID=6257 RepID=A0A915C615_PARUN